MDWILGIQTCVFADAMIGFWNVGVGLKYIVPIVIQAFWSWFVLILFCRFVSKTVFWNDSLSKPRCEFSSQSRLAAAGNRILINHAEKDRVLENPFEVGSLLKVVSFECNAASHGHSYWAISLGSLEILRATTEAVSLPVNWFNCYGQVIVCAHWLLPGEA